MAGNSLGAVPYYAPGFVPHNTPEDAATAISGVLDNVINALDYQKEGDPYCDELVQLEDEVESLEIFLWRAQKTDPTDWEILGHGPRSQLRVILEEIPMRLRHKRECRHDSTTCRFSPPDPTCDRIADLCNYTTFLRNFNRELNERIRRTMGLL